MLNKKLLGSVSSLPSDANFENVSLLLSGDGTNGAQNNTFVDSSTNNFTITRNGNTTQGSFSPYGSNWGNFFDGNGDYLTCSSSATNFGTGDFCVEFWVNFSALPTSGNNANIIAAGATNGIEILWRATGTYIELGRNDVGPSLQYSWTPSIGSWNHIAITRSGSTAYIFLNGALGASGTVTQNFATGTTYIGSATSGTASFLNGYISNLRVVKGAAVYTSAFTPSTTPLTAISGTSLLSCQSNRFIDNSSNNFTLTANGNVSVQRFSPFNPTAPYSTSVIGGSGYFDGSDSITLPSNSALTLDGDFTVEFWVNLSVTSGNPAFWTAVSQTIEVSGSDWIFYNGTTSRTIGAVVGNNWQHIAISRTGSTLQTYLNGVRGVSVTDTTTLDFSGASLGYRTLSPAGNYITGYLSNIRFVKGTGVYTGATITVPTAPVTAITNTSLLLNFTNAGIPDLAMQNNLETVGNAQVSTSVKKYGTGSLAFDGTGDYLRAAYSKAFAFAGNFTVEMWINYSAHDIFGGLVACASSTNPTTGWQLIFNNANDTLTFEATSISFTTSTTLPRNQWNHVAVVRNGSSIVIYINGTSAGSGTSSTVFDSSTFPLAVGAERTPSQFFTGYIDDLRITNGLARYTANFTPPTKALETF